jgi:cell division protein FtsB
MARPRRKTNPDEFRAKLVTVSALVALLLIAAYALLGPTGILAWAEYKSAINERGKELATLEKERDALRNRQRLLDRDNVDPDLAGELMRKELNVVAPDEIVIPLNNEK